MAAVVSSFRFIAINGLLPARQDPELRLPNFVVFTRATGRVEARSELPGSGAEPTFHRLAEASFPSSGPTIRPAGKSPPRVMKGVVIDGSTRAPAAQIRDLSSPVKTWMDCAWRRQSGSQQCLPTMKKLATTFLLIPFLACGFLVQADDKKSAGPATSIDGYRFEFPCVGTMPDKPKQGAGCESALVDGDPNTTDNFESVKTFGGEAGKRYKVTLRFRGVVEPMMYKDGEMDGEYFYRGGEPNNATYNIYKIGISSPQSHYFLNRQDKVGHKIFAIDYTKTIEIDAGATITLRGDGQNGKLISNFARHVVADLAPAPAAFHGQFVQIDVVKVVEAQK